MSEQKAISLLDLNAACSSLGMLLFCSNEWIPQEEWDALADAVRPHLKAAAQVLADHAERNNELLKLCWEDGTAEVVRMEMEDLRHHLSGRRSIGPGNPMHLSHTTTWRRPAEADPPAGGSPESPAGDE
jgi:hypothetical protein